jgi:selenocysteine-specific elongation factor
VHDEPVERADSGQRVAAALTGVERSALRRGDALVEPGAFPTSHRLDVVLEELEPIPDGAHLDVLHGTRQIPARLVRAGDGHAQLRLSEPVLAARGDRVVLRAGRTLGGGRVLDPAPPRTRDPARLELLDRGDPASILRAVVRGPVTRDALLRRGLLSAGELDGGLASLSRAGSWYFTEEWLDERRRETTARLNHRAETSPLDPGLPLAELLPPEPWAADVLPLLGIDRRGGKGYLPGAEASLGDKAAAAEELERRLADGAVVKVDDAAVAAFLESAGRLHRLGDGYAISADGYERARELLVDECRASGRITLARFRDLLGAGRRDTQLLLERFDADGLTRRVGDERVLRRAASAG